MLSFCTGISFTPPFPGETSSWDSTLGKKFCVREMSVEVGSFLVVLGATWGTLEFYPYNRDVTIIFLPTEYAASFSCSWVDCIWLSNGCIRQRCVVGSNSLSPGTKTTVTTRCLDPNLLCSCVP